MPRPPIRTALTPADTPAFLACWPPGIGHLSTDTGELYGLLMRRGAEHVWATAATFPPAEDPGRLADQAADAVLVALHAVTAPPVGAAAFVRDGVVGVAVFAYGPEAPDTPGAGRRDVALGILADVAQAVGQPLSEPAPTPYDALGVFRLEAFASDAGLMFVSPVLRAADDPVWAALTGMDEILHLPCVGFVDDGEGQDPPAP